MSIPQNAKYQALVDYIKNLNNVAIAFSGGVDSTFLLYAAREALNKNVTALTVKTVYIPKWEIEEARNTAQKYNIEHKVIDLPLLDEIKHNPKNRCYLCKTLLFKALKKEAEAKNIEHVLDATNVDDMAHYRPGLKALEELKIKSPLKEVDITKEEIRAMSKELGLSTWDKPAYACLLTRIPYNQEIKSVELERIEKAETYLINFGIKGVRVRTHDNLARIEIDDKYMPELSDRGIINNIVNTLKDIGYQYVTLDLEGYRTGSFDES